MCLLGFFLFIFFERVVMAIVQAIPRKDVNNEYCERPNMALGGITPRQKPEWLSRCTAGVGRVPCAQIRQCVDGWLEKRLSSSIKKQEKSLTGAQPQEFYSIPQCDYLSWPVDSFEQENSNPADSG
mgnify:CR=1 FL=1